LSTEKFRTSTNQRLSRLATAFRSVNAEFGPAAKPDAKWWV